MTRPWEAASLWGIWSGRNNRAREAISFEYAGDWIAGGTAIAPFDLDHQLILGPGRQYARAGAAKLSPAFRDTSPDRWGCMLIENGVSASGPDNEARHHVA